ncbi:UNVERIFIED_ORG: hypothetical protein GGD43_003965 [Rhizobium esperanzae]
MAKHRAENPTRKDHFVRQTYCLGLIDARAKAREWFDEYPKAAYWTEVESWRQLDGDRIEFTMRRLPSDRLTVILRRPARDFRSAGRSHP